MQSLTCWPPFSAPYARLPLIGFVRYKLENLQNVDEMAELEIL